MNPGEIIFNGQLLAAIPIALLAGLVSFASPCVLPLVPGYLGYVGGMSNGARGKTAPARSRVLLGAVLFVLGFSLVFVLIGAFAGTVGAFVVRWEDIITRVLGVVVIVMGLVFIGQFSFLQRTVKSNFRPATGLAGAPILGVVFAVGWTPCLGPTLAGVISLAAGTEGTTAARGVTLIVAYCLGLGLPFIVLALGSAKALRGVGWLRTHARTVQIVGGVLLMVVGIALVTGAWDLFVSWVRDAFISEVILPV